MRIRTWVGAAAVALVLAAPGRAGHAAQLDWNARISDYIVVDQDLRAVLSEISSHLGVPAHIADEVRGRIHEKLPALPARQLLQELSARYGLTWYFDGSGLYFAALKDSTSQILPIGSVSFPFFEQQLGELHILDERFELRYSEAGKLVFAAGPPRYLELVRQALDAANAETANRTQPRNVNVIYGYGSGH